MRKTIKRNKNRVNDFVALCKMSQFELKTYLYKYLREAGLKPISGNGFIYVKGEVPVLLTAHMDTVHHEVVKDVIIQKKGDKTIVSSPQGIGGDDRCGVYMILQLIKKHKCSVLFCEDEEIGGIGSNKFLSTEYAKELKDLSFMIELDRANEKDAVFYDCDNPEFTEYIIEGTGHEEEWGSFSDISNLAPDAKVAAVNLSCGYYKAHTTNEYVVIEEMMHTIAAVDKLLSGEIKKFEYIEAERGYYGYYGYGKGSVYGRSNYYDYDDYDYYGGYYGSKRRSSYTSGGYSDSYYDNDDRWNDRRRDTGMSPTPVKEKEYEILYIGFTRNREDKSFSSVEYVDYVIATSEAEAIGKFLMEHDDLTYCDIESCTVC